MVKENRIRRERKSLKIPRYAKNIWRIRTIINLNHIIIKNLIYYKKTIKKFQIFFIPL